MTRYYLDTTVQIERHAGGAAPRASIESRLATADAHASSTHVQREWRHIVEGAAISVLNALANGAELREVLAKLSQGYGRSPGQRLRLLAMLTGQTLDVELLRIRAELFLRCEADELFRHGLDEVRDGSECGLAREDVQQNAKGRLSLATKCKKTECVCRQPEFLEDKRQGVLAAGEALRAAQGAQNDSLRKLGRKVREVMSKPNMVDRKGSNCWSGLGGDVSIALECRQDETLLTTDRSFDQICPSIGVQHERLAPTPPP